MTRPPARARVLFGARARILTAFVVLLSFSTVLSTLALRQILLVRADERTDRTLSQEVEEFRRLVADGRDPRDGRPFDGDVRAIFDVYLARNVPAPDEDLYTLLDGRPYRSSATGEPDPAVVRRLRTLTMLSSARRGTIETADGPVRYLATPVRVEGRVRGGFVVTEALQPQRDEVDEAVRVAAGVSLAVLLLASALAWLVAGRVLAPLRELRDTAREIGDEDLTRRIEVRGSDEIAELGRTFNAMLDRLERTFDVQRQLVSDAGHELRTPITIIRGHLELLGDDPRERRETVALVTDELDRMARFVDDLLTLAKAERNDFLHLGDVDLDVLTEELLAKAQALASDRVWSADAIAVGRLRGDRQRLTQAVVNLARNAVEHTGPGDAIALGSAFERGEARIWVRDGGPGVAEAEQERIFERFARAGRSRRRSDGAGLGLAIVRAIAEAHGGRVELRSRPGEGATFTVVVPVREEDPQP
ncbi:HAMP domain-containing sensor histidine kinase [Conexibacter stalactiti]|uniref:histidine kinase n=1 Tax=Conexibacter stalactiti TaxID=1940611 RepID=A0ABU4HHQ9_9ACTN|nr:HAMP domain-containing sensor histidine kinase [Conexibacter stalactiti]MDW5592841.1 HAMP domain-containing sensor histidine kinase [Conexibacter stalactiti]MEC5033482.1 HAMP domain-containing sensor histidine kinase [Conexibacter stalactiti]